MSVLGTIKEEPEENEKLEGEFKILEEKYIKLNNENQEILKSYEKLEKTLKETKGKILKYELLAGFSYGLGILTMILIFTVLWYFSKKVGIVQKTYDEIFCN